jgi:DNA integrity scanning protein DisA with diadenylate cyclase activity
MTVSQEFIITLALQIAGGLLALISILVAIIWNSLIKKLDRMEATTIDRLRTLGHEDRAIRSQVHDIGQSLERHSLSLVTDMAAENDRLKWLLQESDKMYHKAQQGNRE